MNIGSLTHGPPQSTKEKLKFCQTTNNSDFILKCVKIFLRKLTAYKNHAKFALKTAFREGDNYSPSL